ncbi:MerR family transcriptional regulator [Sulfitobacter albidus]|uniref:MerR family transcriptional regulator n=1 Tax=Sulfitobacter albidus TaxID=2829501 RepID=UPI0020C8E566|nr:MerR family transcriptional regulator [Sulfitobacter albidus]
MPKSPDAFRTISEVADWLGIQAHVLRFWESKFTQVKPIKRAGGRRYYRPADMQLLGGIKKLLHDDGLTIKGVQKILREQGMAHVSALSPVLDDTDVIDAAPAAPAPQPKPAPAPEGKVLPFEPPQEADAAPAEPAETGQEDVAPGTAEEDMSPLPEFLSTAATEPEPVADDPPVEAATQDAESDAEGSADLPAPPPETAQEAETESPAPDAPAPETQRIVDEEIAAAAQDTPGAAKDGTAGEDMSPLPDFLSTPAPDTDGPVTDNTPAANPPAATEETRETPAADTAADVTELPAAEPSTDAAEEADPQTTDAAAETPQEDADEEVKAAPAADTAPRPRDIGMPAVQLEHEIHAEASALSRATRVRRIAPQTARELAPLLDQLTALRDRMAARRGGGAGRS